MRVIEDDEIGGVIRRVNCAYPNNVPSSLSWVGWTMVGPFYSPFNNYAHCSHRSHPLQGSRNASFIALRRSFIDYGTATILTEMNSQQ